MCVPLHKASVILIWGGGGGGLGVCKCYLMHIWGKLPTWKFLRNLQGFQRDMEVALKDFSRNTNEAQYTPFKEFTL